MANIIDGDGFETKPKVNSPQFEPKEILAQYDNLNEVRDTLLEKIAHTESFLFDYFARQNHAVLNALYQTGLLTDPQLESALEQFVLNEARQDYRLVMRGIEKPDHLGKNEYFAYGLAHPDFFTDQEKAALKFDHGEDLQKYIHLYSRPNLLANLRTELLNPPPPISWDDDPHPVCDCC